MDTGSSLLSNTSDPNYELGLYCPPVHDNILWWPATLANTTAHQICIGRKITSTAHRHCLANGSWEEKTNYSACLPDIDDHAHHHNESNHYWDEDRTTENLLIIMFVGSVISLVVLIITLCIFQRFQSLQCQRTSIHKNLIGSFILRFLVVFVSLEPHVFEHHIWYRSPQWLCRALITLQQFSYLANFFWMFVEGLYLHLILVLRPFNNEEVPFAMFYVLGWVIPLMIAGAWAIVMHFKHDASCWGGSSRVIYILIIYVPIMFALFVNFLILINLVRIVIIKLCTGQRTEPRKIWRTIKSTLLLVFLLGIINLLFFTNGSEDVVITRAYRYVNAFLPFCQGIVVTLIYCGMNGEVRRVMVKRWKLFMNSQSFTGSGYRGRNSRTSVSTFVSKQNRGNEAEIQMLAMQPLTDPKSNGDTSLT